MEKMKELKIGDLTAKLPIIQGGMGVGISLSGLAAAVANEGGIGTIATVGMNMFEEDFSKDYLGSNIRALRKEIRKARELSKGIIAVNIMVALTNYADLVTTSIEEGIDIIISGAGAPGLIKPDMIKSGVIILDAGTSESLGRVVGDAELACAERAEVFTPVPGGLGPVTVAVLFQNLFANL